MIRMTPSPLGRLLIGGRHRILPLSLGLVIAVGLGVVAWLGVDLFRLKTTPSHSMPIAARVQSGGSLVISGGGRLPDEVRDRFLELAGGSDARIVLIPTARSLAYDDADPEQDLEPWTSQGVASVRLLHTRSRATANDPTFASSLVDATGVWIGGGSQSRLSEAYAETEVERQLKALLDRGGVIGGSSAGAAIMTRVMIASGRTDPVEGRGFDFLQGAVVDQHFLKRNRIKRLTKLLERHPDLIGFGIDEETALVVGVRDQQISVVGDSYVVACLPASNGRPARFEILKEGDQTDLAALRKSEPSVVPTIDLGEVASSKHGL
jgi:cyanophycinase